MVRVPGVIEKVGEINAIDLFIGENAAEMLPAEVECQTVERQVRAAQPVSLLLDQPLAAAPIQFAVCDDREQQHLCARKQVCRCAVQPEVLDMASNFVGIVRHRIGGKLTLPFFGEMIQAWVCSG